MSISNRKNITFFLHPLLFHSISLRNFTTTSLSTAIDDDDDISKTKNDTARKTKFDTDNSDASKTMLTTIYSSKKSNTCKSHNDHQLSHCFWNFTPSITVTFYPFISTPRTTFYSDFLIAPRNYDLLTRSYAHFPKMISFPKKPNNAMDHKNLKIHDDPVEFKDGDITPTGAVTELKFAVCGNPDRNSRAPNFKVHNLRAAFQNFEGKIVHLIRKPPLEDPALQEVLMEMAEGLIVADLKTHGIEKAELEEIWWDESRNTEKTEAMWAHGLLKHFRFSSEDLIFDYASTTYQLAKPILKGSQGQLGLGEFLLQEGFEVGKYHDVADLLVSLKKFFGVDVLPSFIGHGGYHPSLFEVGVLTTKDCSKRIDHPMVSKVPKGKFLMRRL